MINITRNSMSEIIPLPVADDRELQQANLENMEEYWRLRLNVAKIALKYATEQYTQALTKLEDFRDQDMLF